MWSIVGLVIFINSLTSTAQTWDYSWPEAWAKEWPEIWQAGSASNCTTSHMNAFETVKTPITLRTSPLDTVVGPKVLPLNTTAGEQWEFDAIAADGTLGIVIGFYRDPNYDMLGAGSFRLSTELVWPNGTRYMQVDYPTDSIIEECEGYTKGTWKSSDFSYVFEISKSLRRSKIVIDTPPMSGTFYINSFTPPRYADGNVYPNANASVMAAPFFYWTEPIPVGHAEIDLVIKGTPFKWSGIGGHERLWVAYSWYSLLEGMHVVRAALGPYSVTYVKYTSKINKGVEYPSVFLVENEKKIFSATVGQESVTENYVKMSKTYDGHVSGSLKDGATGCMLELVSPQSGDRWTFRFVHNVVAFEFPLGEGAGGTGFAAMSSGGAVDGQAFKGVALTEQLVFPKNNPLFRSNYQEL
jgi:hypothetical protein